MDCGTDLNALTQDMIALARLAIAGGIVAIAMFVIYGLTRILNRWRRWDE